MFNRQPFNRGRFNRANTGRVYLEGNAHLCISTGVKLSVSHGFRGKRDIVFAIRGYKGIPTFLQGKAGILVAVKSEELIRYRTLSGKADISIGTSGNANGRISLEGRAGIETAASTSRMNTNKAFHGSSEIIFASVGVLNLSNALQGDADIKVNASGYISRNILFAGKTEILLHAKNYGTGIRHGIQGKTNIIIRASVEQIAMFQFEHIYLRNLVIPVGGELLIDTDNMTVTLNGQNVVRHMSRDSEYFLLSPATNELVYSSNNASNKANINILHKDAWL